MRLPLKNLPRLNAGGKSNVQAYWLNIIGGESWKPAGEQNLVAFADTPAYPYADTNNEQSFTLYGLETLVFC
jgi:hypothetical protein